MAEKTIKLRPFQVPNYVIQETAPSLRQDGFKEAPKYALADLEAETLAALCDEFRAAVFDKAGKPDPAAVIR